MANSVIEAAILAAWLCVPAFAAESVRDDAGRGSALPGHTTSQVSDERDAVGNSSVGEEERRDADRRDLEAEEERTERDLREAPGAAPGTAPGRVRPGEQPQPYRGTEPGAIERGTQPDAPGGVPEPGRRWGLFVFVIAIVALGLLAFRRRGPMPPAP